MFVRGGGDNTNNAYAEQENAGSCFFKMILILDILTIMIIYYVSVNRWCLSRPRYQQQAASLKHQSSISKPGRLQSLYIIVPGDQPDHHLQHYTSLLPGPGNPGSTGPTYSLIQAFKSFPSHHCCLPQQFYGPDRLPPAPPTVTADLELRLAGSVWEPSGPV